MIGGLATIQPLSHPLSPKLSHCDPYNFLSLSNLTICLTLKKSSNIFLACSRGVNARAFMSESCKKKASFIYYSEFLALQKSSGEKKLIHKSFGPKKKLYKKERVLFLGASADFLFSREGWIVFYTDDYKYTAIWKIFPCGMSRSSSAFASSSMAEVGASNRINTRTPVAFAFSPRANLLISQFSTTSLLSADYMVTWSTLLHPDASIVWSN